MSDRTIIMLQFAQQAWDRGEFFFYIRIPEPLQPVDRGFRYEEPLDDALRNAALGCVTGGGSKLTKDGSIEYCGLDVVVREHQRGLEIIRTTLQHLQAPPTTIIEEYLPTYREHVLQSQDG